MIEPIAELRKRCSGRTQKVVAAELGVSQQYLNDVLNGRKEPGKGILGPLGIERIVTYRKRRNGQ